MEFFDPKQEVLNLKLTAKGREKLAKGIFKPAFYAFRDSSLIYDDNYIGQSGSQNQLQARLNENVRIKSVVFPSHENAEKFFPNFNEHCVLGTSEYGVNKKPAFELKIYSGMISGTIDYITSTFFNERVPKLTINMNSLFDQNQKTFKKEESFFIELNEINSIFEKENFEFSISLVERLPRQGIQETTKLLEFEKEKETEFFSENFSQMIEEVETFNSGSVEYWFDVLVDEEIDFPVAFDVNNIDTGNKYLLVSGSNGEKC